MSHRPGMRLCYVPTLWGHVLANTALTRSDLLGSRHRSPSLTQVNMPCLASRIQPHALRRRGMASATAETRGLRCHLQLSRDCARRAIVDVSRQQPRYTNGSDIARNYLQSYTQMSSTYSHPLSTSYPHIMVRYPHIHTLCIMSSPNICA